MTETNPKESAISGARRVRPPGLWRRILETFRPYWNKSIWIVAGVLLTSTVGLINPLLVRQIIDVALPHHDLSLLGKLALAMVGVTLFSGLIDTFETYQTTQVGQHVMSDLRRSIYSHLQKMALRFFTESRAGEILARISSDVSGVQELVTTTASQILSDILLTVTTLALMFALSWKLTLIGLSMLPFFIYPTRVAGSVRRTLSREVQKRVADLQALMAETLSVSGALLTKIFGRQELEIARFSELNNRLRDLEIRKAMLGQIFWVTLQAFWAASPALIYWIGGKAIGEGRMTLGSVVAFVALQNRLFFPLGRLFGVQVQIQGSLSMFERIFEYLDLPVEVADTPEAKPLVLKRGEIRFEDVTFRYPSARTTLPALSNVSFTAPPGKLTALVGPSGAGKTSITYLVSRLYDVTSGHVTIDGQDVKNVTTESLLKSIAIVTQETFLFHSTIAENLRYGNDTATQADLENAARAAHIHDTISNLPDGYKTLVGERGYKLSGGERQRLAIARVLLKNAPIVILDEATSALDTASERLVQAAFETLMIGRTTIAIAHRLSTVLRADQILVLDHGTIVEQGGHDTLYRQNGLYKKLVDEQFSLEAAPRPALVSR